MKITFSLQETSSQISSKILNALLPDVQKKFNKIYILMSQKIPDILINNMIKQPEYSALISGNLQYELGITNPSQRVSQIFDQIKQGMQTQKIDPKIKSSTITSSIKVNMIKKDFSDLLSLSGSSLTTEKGQILPWLSWLLLEGDSIIISNHSFILGPSRYSRTGFGLMQESVSGFWRVPPEYAGSVNNNWITRAIDDSQKDINDFIEKLVR